jgi:hypothetical protein
MDGSELTPAARGGERVPTNIPTVPTRANCRAKDCPRIDLVRIGALVVMVICGTTVVILGLVDGVSAKEWIALVGALAWGLRIDRGQVVTAAKIEETKAAVDDNTKVTVEAAAEQKVTTKEVAEELAITTKIAAAEIKAVAKETAQDLATTTIKTADALAEKLEVVHKNTNGAKIAEVAAAFEAGVQKGREGSNPG